MVGGGYLADNQIAVKLLKYSLSKLIQIIYSSVGLVQLLFIVGCYDKCRRKQTPAWVIRIGGLCMGVYLMQQFILKLFYSSFLSSCFGPYLLPWMGFLVALLFSLLISYLLRLFKIGRFLLG